jgi:lipoprotein-releasing system permease protein
VTSVMGGFGHEIHRMMVETQGDVQLRSAGVIENAEEVQAKLARIPGVIATTPFAEGVVMLKRENRPVIPAIQGIDLQRARKVIPLERYVTHGALEALDDDSIILSVQIAINLGVRIGDTVEIWSPLILERLTNNEVLLPRELRVVGIFEIGHQHLDSSVALVTLRLMQELYGLDRTVHGVNIKIAPDLDADVAAKRINDALGQSMRARSWRELNQGFLFVLQLEKNMIFFLLTFIVVVAAFSVMSSLLISVVRKTREIGLLGALGGRAKQVAACFCFQGLIIGTAGTVVGLVLGFVALYFRNNIVGLFTRLTQSEQALRSAYQFNELPSHPEPEYIVTIVVCSIVISTLAGMIPAWRAAKLKPVEALRSE